MIESENSSSLTPLDANERQPTSMHEMDQEDWTELSSKRKRKNKEDPEPADLQRQTVVFSCPVDHSGMQVFIKGWLAPDSTRPPLIVVHDLGENISGYRDFARRMVHFGFSVYAFDLRGHGRSGRMLGHITDFDDLTSDLLQVAAWIRHQEKGRLPIIVGQGLGGLIALHFAQNFAKYCKGLVIASPCWKPKKPIRWYQKLAVRWASEFLPTWRFSSRVLPRLAPKTQIARFSIIGPIRQSGGFKITSSFARELISAMEEAETSLKTHVVPTLLMLPNSDPFYDYSAIGSQMQAACEAGSSELKTVNYEFDGHRILSDPGEHFLLASNDINQWVAQLSQSDLTSLNADEKT
jgi:acylglycerol lipase